MPAASRRCRLAGRQARPNACAVPGTGALNGCQGATRRMQAVSAQGFGPTCLANSTSVRVATGQTEAGGRAAGDGNLRGDFAFFRLLTTTTRILAPLAAGNAAGNAAADHSTTHGSVADDTPHDRLTPRRARI